MVILYADTKNKEGLALLVFNQAWMWTKKINTKRKRTHVSVPKFPAGTEVQPEISQLFAENFSFRSLNTRRGCLFTLL